MNVKRIFAVDQISEDCQNLSIKNNTTKSICGYIVCGLCQYLAELDEVTQTTLQQVNFQILKPYIQRAMQTIAKNRKMQVKKFMNQMNESQRKSYMTDWVANFEIADYLQHISEKIINHQVFFFRQVAVDHPEALQKIKYQQAQRIKQQQQFKGQRFFYNSFNPLKNNVKQYFIEQIKKCHNSKLPIIIATDVLGHFNTTVILGGKVYVLDSLPNVQGQYDNNILQAICYYFQVSYLKE